VEEFFTALSGQCKAKRKEVVEKDYYLHRLLCEISKDSYLCDKLVFKGGTCLVKAYSGYYRFSEDIDFTWANNGAWLTMGSGARDAQCMREAENAIQKIKTITDRLGLNFSGVKNGADVHFSSGGKMVYLKPTYFSELNKARAEVKIELNFVDVTVYPTKEMELRTYLDDVESPELEILYEEPYRTYSNIVRLNCYDCKEIFIEKCRAIMTRKTYKPRDSLDIYMMGQIFGYRVPDFEAEIIKKVEFAIKTYSRYQENIKLAELPEPSDVDFDDNNLLLIDTPVDLEASIGEIHEQLEEIRQKVIQDMSE